MIIGSSIVLFLHWANRPQAPSVDVHQNSLHNLIAGKTKPSHTSLSVSYNMSSLIDTMSAKVFAFPAEPTLVINLPLTATCHGRSFKPSITNIFLYHAVCNISSSKDIAQFSGSSMANLFDLKRTKLHYTVNQKLSTWSEVAHDLNQTRLLALNQSIHDRAVHMHNYHKLGDFMLLFWTEYFRFGPSGKSLKRAGKGLPLTSEQLNWAIGKGQPPVVITNWGDENWGHLSGRK